MEKDYEKYFGKTHVKDLDNSKYYSYFNCPFFILLSCAI